MRHQRSAWSHMKLSPTLPNSNSCLALLKFLPNEHVQAILFTGQEDHKHGVSILWRHASQFDSASLNQLSRWPEPDCAATFQGLPTPRSMRDLKGAASPQ